MEPDFGGYATKAGLRCSDGRTIKAEAFQHMDGKKVPLVWMHGHNDSSNVLGHVLLEAREDGVYGKGFFNKTVNGQNAKIAVEHGDLDALSIWANGLKEFNKNVSHGNIREVSLVLAGANPGAKIDYVRIQHGEDPSDYTELDDEALIQSGTNIELPDSATQAVAETEKKMNSEKQEAAKKIEDAKDATADAADKIEHADDGEVTVADVYNSMTVQQQTVVQFMIGEALEEAQGSSDSGEAQHAENNDEAGIAHQEGNTDMGRNLFETAAAETAETETTTLSHSDMKGIFASAAKLGSLKEAVETYALQHGITNIDILFPDAKNVTGAPELDKRRTEWVSVVLGGTRHTPFSRIKTFSADLTQDEARAKGYIKGNYKVEEWFGVTKRTTTPTTVYKKQKLDRDDMLDITDFDIVAFLKAEMRLMLEEELARAILLGDGRDISSDDKIKDPMGASSGDGIRSILNDHEYYVTQVYVNTDADGMTYDGAVDSVMNAMEFYKGAGTPTFFTTIPELNKFLQARDGVGRRYYETKQALADALGVDKIVTVEVMKEYAGLIGIIVNLADYNVGTDAGGEVTMFDQFDIDYNQQKYLLETRLSGALVHAKSALVLKKTTSTNVLAVPLKPSFNSSTGVVTIPSVTGVVYKGADGTTTLSAGAQSALSAGASTQVSAIPASGYFFTDSQVDGPWSYKRPSA